MYRQTIEKENTMKNEETFLESKYGHKTPFTVPKDYFTSFHEELLTQMPIKASDKPKAHLHILIPVKKRWRYGVAATLLLLGGAITTLQWLLPSTTSKEMTTAHGKTDQQVVQAVNVVADCAMMDKDDMYAYLAEN